MAESATAKGGVPPIRFEVHAGSDLDRALTAAEGEGRVLEIIHGAAVYCIVPASAPIEETDRAWGRALALHTFAVRDRQEPLDITTAQLIRQARSEDYDAER